MRRIAITLAAITAVGFMSAAPAVADDAPYRGGFSYYNIGGFKGLTAADGYLHGSHGNGISHHLNTNNR
ncbi:hypothetical protein [Streptomyces alboniger]|uniref:Uncharacterized protein n=1 Tax=Streptomyces alboniger TaxID=132473 RepID=A0A5J6HLW3_STRAD|nr:hypothetical protein [Streptomyces alboniger]QEV21216.1 hypothetical protein CP975_30020 [Streptomyces alboniger]